MEAAVAEATTGHRGGSGEPLVLIHGGGGTWRQWGPVLPYLEAHHDVLAVNLPGHWGGAPLPAGEQVDIDLLAGGVARDLDALGWEAPHVAGISLGGLVGLVLARGGRARTCTAIATVGGWDRGGDLGLRAVARSYRIFDRVTELMARDPRRWSCRPRLRRLLYWHHFARTDRMDPAETALMIVGAARCAAIAPLMDWATRHDGPDGLDQIDCPAQLLFPTKDRVFPRRRYGERLQRAVPHAQAHDLPGAGHCATWDAPELVAAHILGLTGGTQPHV